MRLQIEIFLCMLNLNDSVVITGQKKNTHRIRKKTGMGEAHVAHQIE